MRKLFIGLLLLAALQDDHRPWSPASGPTPATARVQRAPRARRIPRRDPRQGPPGARGAWGDNTGADPRHKRISRDELEKRELLLMCYFNHDSYKVVDDIPVAGGERRMTVSLTGEPSRARPTSSS